MTQLIYIVVLLGLFEIVSNLFHLLKGTREKIGLSAKRQHQELPLDLNYQHFYWKAWIMFVFGLAFTASGLMAYIMAKPEFLFPALTLFAIYGLAQAIYYRRTYKVWTSAIVYILPLLFLVFLSSK
jgi:hypothetical protein